jgi:ABC-type nickel/cobalt efflux system permease component RcnA
MDWQQPASLAIVALTGFFFIRREIRSRRRARTRACGSDCGCAGEKGDAPSGMKGVTEHELLTGARDQGAPPP